MTILQVTDLEIVRGQRQLTSALNWQIDRGEFWCVLGKNGAGKTTLLQVLAGLSSPSKGQIQLCSDPLQTTSSALLAQRRGLMLQQQVDVFAHAVFDAVVISRTLKSAAENNKALTDSEVVSAALERVGMAGSESRNILTLSGGERQRVALAALLVQTPDLLLLDEPVSHQDVAQQLQVMQLLRELSDQHAVVSSCHDINLAKRFATHVLVLGEGQHWLGPVNEMLVPEILSVAFGCDFMQQGDWLMPF
jgi:iron complex transport system ATP-binding protein